KVAAVATIAKIAIDTTASMRVKPSSSRKRIGCPVGRKTCRRGWSSPPDTQASRLRGSTFVGPADGATAFAVVDDAALVFERSMRTHDEVGLAVNGDLQLHTLRD